MPSYLLWCSQITRSSSSEVKWMIREKSRQTLQTHTEDKSVATSVTHHFSWQCLTAEFPQVIAGSRPRSSVLTAFSKGFLLANSILCLANISSSSVSISQLFSRDTLHLLQNISESLRQDAFFPAKETQALLGTANKNTSLNSDPSHQMDPVLSPKLNMTQGTADPPLCSTTPLTAELMPRHTLAARILPASETLKALNHPNNLKWEMLSRSDPRQHMLFFEPLRITSTSPCLFRNTV